MKICICGDGSLGHVCAGVMASQEGAELNILSGHPDRWSNKVVVTDVNGKQYAANINKVSSNPQEVISDQDIILFCLPGYLIEKTLFVIKPYIANAAVGAVVSSTGFFSLLMIFLGRKLNCSDFNVYRLFSGLQNMAEQLTCLDINRVWQLLLRM